MFDSSESWLEPQKTAPLLEALKRCAERSHAAFYAPGHKRGQGIAQPLADLFGTAVFKADLPELPDLDNLFAPEGVIQQAQELAAAAFGAEQTWFLANGSTCGIEAAVLAVCSPGDKLILPRNAHQSAIAALVLSGAVPIFVQPEYDPVWDIAHSITAQAVADALEQHPDAKAVMMVYPTYYGVCGDIKAIADLAHRYQIPLLVDEAHGSHFAFHPSLPTSALAAGADLAVQSIHKVLGSMTQSAMLHTRGSLIDRDRVSRALQLVQSTSPSYLLLASLDAARWQMALYGEALMSQTIALAQLARTQISQILGLAVLQVDSAGGTPGFITLDQTRLTVNVAGLQLTGFEADEILHQDLGVTAELPSLRNLTFIISLGNTSEDIEQLVNALTHLTAKAIRYGQGKTKNFAPYALPSAPLSAIAPRDAFFAPTETVAIAKAVDRVSAELVCPYPPGIPLLLPGEVITAAAIEYLQQISIAGGVVTGCADSSLQTLKVVKD